MSFLDKINDSLADTNNTDDLYKNQVEELQNQLKYANEKNNQQQQEISKLKKLLHEKNNNSTNDIETEEELIQAKKTNEKHLQEINELKSLLNQYSNHVTNLKQSYHEEIDDLKSQLNFEKEINVKYLSRIVESNENITKNVKQININSKEVKNEISDENNFDEINKIKDNIADNKKVLSDNIAQLRNEQEEYNNQIIDTLSNQNNNISTETLDDLKTLISDKHMETTEIINENQKSQKDILNDIVDKIPQQFNENDLIEKISNTIKDNNQEIIDSITNNNDTTKIEILNKISDDLRNENYINLESYKKIKDMKLFDEVFYKKEYNYNLDIDPLLHFIYKGYEENKRPRRNFHPLEYKRSNKNIEDSNLNPLVYFVTRGLKEGNIKINDDFVELEHINKYEIDEKLNSFTARGVKKSKRKPRIIVSLTSIPERVHELQYTLYSLLNQEVKPDKVMLWLSDEQFPNGEIDLPKAILKLKKNGLSLRFCDDYKSYTKIIPALKNYPNDIIVTADDDIYYPPNWLKVLYEDYRNNNDVIIGHRVYNVGLDEEGKFEDYKYWSLCDDENKESYLNFTTGVGGVLYPPHSFYEDIDNEELFLDLCEYGDDIWLWAMSVLNHKKIKVARNSLGSSLIYVNPAREKNLTNEFTLGKINNLKNYNDIQLRNVLDKYPEILDILKEE